LAIKKQSTVQKRTDKLYIVYVSTFPPRKCGIATFTEDLVRAMGEMLAPMVKSKIVAMNPHGVLSYNYPRKVIFWINQDNQQEYIDIANRINHMEQVQLVNIQHEFGIFGGQRGSYLIPFMKTLNKPKVITFHTVSPNPDEELLNIVCSIAENVNTIIVMTNLSKKILTQEYGVAARKIRIIPHGIHPQPFTESKQAKITLGYSERVVLSTFGLLNKGKGLEYVIDALPEVIKVFPNFIYIIFGATHPIVLQEEGESYRNSLIEKIYDLNLYDHVRLYNKYFPLNELLHFLKATDIYISTSLDPNQAVSGTLSYALGTGRPVISTSFAQAKEIITDEVGILVDFKNPKAYSDAILRLLGDEEWRLQLGQNAYFRTRNMMWNNVALHYTRIFSQHAKGLVKISKQRMMPKIKIDHIIRLTDDFGIIQFAALSKPDISSGYTLDDNARALWVAITYVNKIGASLIRTVDVKHKRQLLRLTNTYLDFIEFVIDDTGHFDNYVNTGRTLNDDLNKQNNLDDANARALYALALSSTSSYLPRNIKQKAFGLLESGIKGRGSFHSPRAMARYISTLHVLFDRKAKIAGLDILGELRSQCNKIIHLYNMSSSTDWQWFEKYLTYSNAVLPESLLIGYQIMKEDKYLEVGKKTLDFLIEKSFINSVFIPIGQEGWYHRGGKRFHFDQQPEEVTSMIYALKACYKITKDEYYSNLMYQAFYWFLGDNSLNQVVYDRMTGGCYDGLGKKTINLNQGAESTISYLLARLAFE
jgi:glycosyltransferase involved in cell wall biosynthesis